MTLGELEIHEGAEEASLSLPACTQLFAVAACIFLLKGEELVDAANSRIGVVPAAETVTVGVHRNSLLSVFVGMTGASE